MSATIVPPGRLPEPARVLRLGALLLALAAGCKLPGQPDPAGRPAPADQVVNFGAMYRQHCSGCHGADGRLGPAPPLNDPLFLAIVPDEELLMTISGGRPGTPMPAFAIEAGGPLTSDQVAALAGGIKPRWGRPAAASGPAPPEYAASGGDDERDGPGDRGRGAAAFDRACASCHGPRGEGGMAGDRPVGAINDRAFLALISDQALRRYAITGRPDLGMPDYAGKSGRDGDYRPLSSREIADLVAFLAAWREGGGASPEGRGSTTTNGETRSE